MTALFEVGIIVLKSITLVFGALITYFAYRAFATTRAKPIGALGWVCIHYRRGHSRRNRP